jgi:hypothetical protein
MRNFVESLEEKLVTFLMNNYAGRKQKLSWDEPVAPIAGK